MTDTMRRTYFFSVPECDINYVNPATYEPPAVVGNGVSNGAKNGIDDDPYERIVRSSLNVLEKQKVRAKIYAPHLYISTYQQCFL